MNKGFIYRWGIRVKNIGEKMARYRVLRPFCGPVIGLGLFIKNIALNCPVKDM